VTEIPRRPAGIARNAALIGLAGLGPLETKVLDYLWDQRRALTVRQAQLNFPELAYTTLMTTLDRLFRKRLLVRRRLARAYTYEPRYSRHELLSEMVSGQVADLLRASGTTTAVLSTLVRAVGRRDAALLNELDALVQAECTRLKRKDK
jgi:predicted transcriptional regulator